jgi:hypothetical protein
MRWVAFLKATAWGVERLNAWGGGERVGWEGERVATEDEDTAFLQEQ